MLMMLKQQMLLQMFIIQKTTSENNYPSLNEIGKNKKFNMYFEILRFNKVLINVFCYK